MKMESRQPAAEVPLVFLALGSSLAGGSLIGALYSLVQLWRLDGDTAGWVACALAFLAIAAAVTPMMVGLGYGRSEVRRLLRFYSSPIRVMHKRKNRPIVLSGTRAGEEDDITKAA